MEGPHARFTSIARHSHAANWPWVASTQRLVQNLVDYDYLVSALGADFAAEWSVWTSIFKGGSQAALHLHINIYIYPQWLDLF